MSQIILDISANTHRNDMRYVKRMIDNIKSIDTGKHEIIFKHQLFEKAGANLPLDHAVFDYAYEYAKHSGYKTTSSVFDIASLSFLLKYDPCFVKIANNRKLDWLIGEVPRRVPIYVSVGDGTEGRRMDYEVNRILHCVSKYPSTIEDYETAFFSGEVKFAISDHSIGLDLFKKYQPQIWEKHYVLEHDENNLDGGLFATTPTELEAIL